MAASSFLESWRKQLKLYWLDIVVLVVIAVAMGIIEALGPTPRERYLVLTDPDIQYPYAVQETIPVWLLVVLAVVIPVVLLILMSIIGRRKEESDLVVTLVGTLACFAFLSYSTGICLGFGLAVLMTMLLTDIVKNFVGRFRPDFLDRCDWNGSECTGSVSVVEEGRRSFPSGHSSSTD